jgi:hypothetical protein
MRSRGPAHLETAIAALTLALSTVGFLLNAYALIVIGLVGGGISLGILVGAPRKPD